MIAAFPIFLMAAAMSGESPVLDHATVCAAGAAAISDLAGIDSIPPSERYYGGRNDAYHSDILAVCPSLAHTLPPGLPLATDPVFERVRDIVSRHPVTIYWVGIPAPHGDLRHVTITFGYRCNGVCGAELEATYVRKGHGWIREGKPRFLSVS